MPLPHRQFVINTVIIVSLFLEFLDQTIITTAIPVIAREFSINPVNLKFGLTAYYLALVLVIPASGWIGDRFGARPTFIAAILLFSLGSLLCGLANSLPTLVAARFLQGVGGALLVPVGRLIILRDVKPSAMISTLTWLALPAVFGPMLGPLAGGGITTFLHWRWIFWINLPIGCAALALAFIYLEQSEADRRRRFDISGYIIIASGLTSILCGCAVLMHGALSLAFGIAAMTAGVLIVACYPAHARRSSNPLIDPAVFDLPTFRASMWGGIPFRIANGSIPFLLPIFFQTGLGFSALSSGVLVFASGLAAMFMNSRIAGLLQRFGFRELLAINGVVCAMFIALLASLIYQSSILIMFPFLFIFGLFRSIQYSCINALSYAEVRQPQMSSATSVVSVTHPLSNSIGVSAGAIVLELVMSVRPGQHVPIAADFPPTFCLIAFIGLLSTVVFFKLSRDAGREMTGHT